mgnify:CR=1 FL=1
MTYKTFAFYQISVGAHKQIFLLVNSHLLTITFGIVPGPGPALTARTGTVGVASQ